MDALIELSTWITAALTTLVTGGLKKVIQLKDISFETAMGKIVEADGKIVEAIKAFMPVVVAVLAFVIGAVGGSITGSEVPTADAAAAAPLATVISIIFRELWVRFVKPLLEKV